MRVVITGNPQAGQQQLFSVLTGISMDTVSQKPMEVQQGICEVRDPRIKKLSQMYKPKKTTYAKIEYTLLPDFNLQGPTKALVFTELKNADEICWVCASGTAKDDIDSFVSELVISDMVLIEKRLESIEKDQKRKFLEEREKEKAILSGFKKLVDEGTILRGVTLSEEDWKIVKTLQLLSLKPIVCAINAEEGEKPEEAIKFAKETYQINAVVMNAQLEEEIGRLPEAEREEFMKELGIDEPAIDKMTRIVFSELGLISFFTVGEDEVRAWPIRKGSNAAEAGGAIHSDIAKGFVRAELMKYADLIEQGSEAKLKETGKFNLKGRDHIVEDSDIMNFRFNV